MEEKAEMAGGEVEAGVEEKLEWRRRRGGGEAGMEETAGGEGWG